MKKFLRVFFAFRVMKFLFEWAETLGSCREARLRLGVRHGWSPVRRKDVEFEFSVPVTKPWQVMVLREGEEKSQLQVLFALQYFWACLGSLLWQPEGLFLEFLPRCSSVPH